MPHRRPIQSGLSSAIVFYRWIWVLVTLVLIGQGTVTVAQPQPVIVGHIAYIGADHNIYIVGPNGVSVALTVNGSPARRYQFPTWSSDGRLAFFCCDVNFAPEMAIEAYVATPDLTASKLLYSASNEGYTYSYWSPSNCADGPTCRDLAVLLSRRGASFKVELIRQNGTTTSSRMVGTGAPFYLSWNQDGHRMLWYRNNAQISLFDARSDVGESSVAVIPSGMQAPSWSPVDDRAAMILLENAGESNALVILDGDERSVLIGGIPGLIRGSANIMALSWSPDGRFIAYRAINRYGASPVFVTDAASGETIAATADVNVVAFFWSPDSRKIAYMTPGSASGSAGTNFTPISFQGGANSFSWSLLDVASGSTQPLATFTPSASMFYLLAYFDQFSQSHRIWSPDSRYLVYADITDGGNSSVKILDTTDTAPVPFTLAEGDIGIWSYQ